MARILVTYGWCRTSYLILRSLVALGHEVYACSHLRPAMASWSRFSRGGAVVRDPFAHPEAFTHDVGELVDRWQIDLVFPGHEDAVALRSFENLLPERLKLVCPPLGALLHAIDKAAVTRSAMTAGVPVPDTAFPSSIEGACVAARKVGFPVVLKLRRSNGGKGVRVARSQQDVIDILRGPFADFVDGTETFPLVQRYCRGQIVGGCFLSVEGELRAEFGERYLRTKDNGFGTSTYREIERSPAIGTAAARLVRELCWSGIGHIDFIEDVDAAGQLRLIEMNPRPWGAIHLAYINGFDFPGAAVALALGEDDVSRFFSHRPPDHGIRSIWWLGEAIRFVSTPSPRRPPAGRPAWIDAIRSRAKPDDFALDDPLPFMAELLCYGIGYVRSGGDINPTSEGMLG